MEAAILEVLIEACLVNGHDRTEPHRHGRELPEVGHQPRVGVGRKTAVESVPKLSAEIEELFLGQPPLEEGAGVDAGRGVALEVDLVAVVVLALAVEEVVERDLVQSCCGGVGRNVAADAVLLDVGAHHHRHRVPPHQALDPPFDFPAARKRRLLGDRNRVDVRSGGLEWDLNPRLAGVHLEIHEKLAHPFRAPVIEDPIQGLQPLPSFDRVGGLGVHVSRRNVAHIDL
jgi:hypothetical protein